jgi:hypothetical protein
MSDDATTREDQAAIERLTQGAMRQLAAGRSADDVSLDLQATGLAKSTCDALVEHVQQRWREIAAAPQANAEAYFRTKYPEMRPVRSTPWLFNVHGVGAGMYNERDRDPASGTFVKTHCLCLLFVPILALGAYRVYPRGSGWTLIGRVPLSGFARCWNVLLLLGIAAWIGLTVWYDEDEAARVFARGDEAAAAGDLLGAVRLYAEVARDHRDYAGAACQRCVRLVDRPELDRMPMPQVAQVFEEVLRMPLNRGQSRAVRRRAEEIARRRIGRIPWPQPN